MRLFTRVAIFLIGASLAIMAISGYFLRQEPSTAYWVFGEIETATTMRYVLNSPTGDVQHILLDTPRTHRLQFLSWLPDREKFIYEWRDADNLYEIHLLDLRNPRHPVALTQHSFAVADDLRSLVLTHDQRWLILPLTNQEGVALFRVSRDGRVLEQISPYFDAILRTGPYLTSDNEWLYYQARNLGERDSVLYRQHIDGSQRAELLRTQQDMALLRLGDTLFVTVNERGVQVTTTFYRITSVDFEPQLVWSGEGLYFLLWQPYSDWLILLTSPTEAEVNDQKLYRVRPSGEDFALLIENAIPLGYTTDGDNLYYLADDPDVPVVMSVNINTLEHHQIIAPGTFDEINSVRFAPTNRLLMMNVVVDGIADVYQSNLDGSNVQVFDNTIQTNTQPVSGDVPDWRLIATASSVANQPQTTYTRIHRETGERQDLITLPFSQDNIMQSGTPDRNTIILTTGTSSHTVTHYWLRLSDGQVGTADFGLNISYSTIIDTDWQMAPSFIAGIVFLMLSIGQFIRRIRHYKIASKEA